VSSAGCRVAGETLISSLPSTPPGNSARNPRRRTPRMFTKSEICLFTRYSPHLRRGCYADEQGQHLVRGCAPAGCRVPDRGHRSDNDDQDVRDHDQPDQVREARLRGGELQKSSSSRDLRSRFPESRRPWQLVPRRPLCREPRRRWCVPPRRRCCGPRINSTIAAPTPDTAVLDVGQPWSRALARSTPSSRASTIV
jgi:hypothetical protein